MTAPQPDWDVARALPLRARLTHRLARAARTAPAVLAPAAPMVSFTFDDAPACACSIGAGMLDAYGAKGTFYVSGGLIGTQAPHWRLADDEALAALHRGGHEIGCHTYSHAFLPDLGAGALAAEIRRNRERLRAAVPELEPTSFAFPFGFCSFGAKRVLKQSFRSSRSIRPGINVGSADLTFLLANPLTEADTDEAAIGRLLDDALACNGWVIFFGHDVAEAPSPYGCTPRLLDAALRAAVSRGMACLSVAEGLRRATAQDRQVEHMSPRPKSISPGEVPSSRSS